MRMPAIFFGHGSPLNALESNQFTKSWVDITKGLQKPSGVVVISAHWETIGTCVTSNEKQRTIHDFGSFPEELYKVEYNAPGSPSLVSRIQELIPDVRLDDTWGLDHGAWCVLKHILPRADVPVVQLSIDQTKSPLQHYHTAKKLISLREQGILIIGSGNIVHNLELTWTNSLKPYTWAIDFNEQVKKAILQRDHQKLINFYSLNGALQSVPTSEHFIPLIYVLSQQKNNENAFFFADAFVYASLSMTSVFIN